MNNSSSFKLLFLVGFIQTACGPLYAPKNDTARTPEIETKEGRPFIPRRKLRPPPFPPVLKPGLHYLSKVGFSIQQNWASYLETLRITHPPSHRLNDYVLETTLEIALNQNGELVETKVLSTSGESDYDRAAEAAVKSGAPYEKPPRYRLSDDGLLHLTWLFARDRRQAGVGGGNFRSIQVPTEVLVRKLALDGKPGRAAHVLSRDLRRVKEKTSLLKLIAIISLEQAALSGKKEVSEHSIDTLSTFGVSRSLETLRRVAFSSTTTSDQAIMALAKLRDTKSVDGLKSLLLRTTESRQIEVLAEALILLGEDVFLAEQSKTWIESGDSNEKTKGLRTLAFSVKAADKSLILKHTQGGDSDQNKQAAVFALGGLMVFDNAVEKNLLSCLTSVHTKMRLECYRGLYLAVRKGFRSAELFGHVRSGANDQNAEIRRNAYLIAAAIDPNNFVKNVSADREKDDENVLVIVNELAKIQTNQATERLLLYAKSNVPRIRGRALRGLIDRDTPSAWSTIFEGMRDSDENVRVEALSATDQFFVPSDYNHSPSVKVKAIALQRWMSQIDNSELVGEFGAYMADSKDINERAFWASLWLSTNRRQKTY